MTTTFREDFPSIVKMYVDGHTFAPRDTIPLLALKMHCLDKQCVREIILALEEEWFLAIDDQGNTPKYITKILLEELNL